MSGELTRLETNLFSMLERACGSRSAMRALLDDLALELNLSGQLPGDALAALALIRLGHDGQKVASMLEWNEFEDLCAKLLSSSGYAVARNIVLTKPRKQIDLLATSDLIGLSVDCKHYARGISPSSLARFAGEQRERTELYKAKKAHVGPLLPIILTLVEAEASVIDGVPVVPLLKLRSFLQSVNPYEGLAVV